MIKYKFSQLVDVEKLQTLIDALYDAAGIRTGVFDINGDMVTTSDYNEVGINLYKKKDANDAKFVKNNENICTYINEENYVIYRLKNGTYYAEGPIVIKDSHLATVFYGPFLLEKHTHEFCDTQLKKTAFTREKIQDIKGIKVLDLKKIKFIMKCLVKFYEWVVEIGYKQLECISSKEKDIPEEEVVVKQVSYYHPITGLKNRTYIMKNLPKAIDNIIKQKKKASLIFLDIDNFKAVNDTYGHLIGDKFLKKVSQRLKNCLNRQDEVYHFGGDEFLFLINSVTDKEKIKNIGNMLLDEFKKPFYIENHNIYYITASIGIDILDSDKSDFQTLFNHADDAMHYAKKEGKDRFKIYTSSMHSKLYYETKLQNDLKNALNNFEFKVYYQPKIEIATGNISGVEALARWVKSDGTIISPSKFIGFAEKTGLIGYISEMITREACIQNKIWQGMRKINFRTAVNLSAFELQDKELFKKIQLMLKDTGLSPKFFEVEITESIIMKNFKQSIYTLNKLREIGVKVSLDDFGTGYSSLNYLKNLPIDAIKLDKSFVDNLSIDAKERFIVSTIINLSHGVDLKVIAEGVESKEQLQILQDYKCDEIQGYYFSKPVPPKEFEGKFL